MQAIGISVMTIGQSWSPMRDTARAADPTVNLDSARQSARFPKILSEADVERLLAAPDPSVPINGNAWSTGTGTLTHRKPDQRVVSLPELEPLMQRELARGGRAAAPYPTAAPSR